MQLRRLDPKDETDRAAFDFPPAAKDAYLRCRWWQRGVGKHPVLGILGSIAGGIFVAVFILSGVFESGCDEGACISLGIGIVGLAELPFILALIASMASLGVGVRAWRRGRKARKHPQGRMALFKWLAERGEIERTDLEILKWELKRGDDDLLRRVRRALVFLRALSFWLSLFVLTGAIIIVVGFVEGDEGIAVAFGVGPFIVWPCALLLRRAIRGASSLAEIERDLGRRWEAAFDIFEDEILGRNRARFVDPPEAAPPSPAAPRRAAYRRA